MRTEAVSDAREKVSWIVVVLTSESLREEKVATRSYIRDE
jgi:hypothetical protein